MPVVLAVCLVVVSCGSKKQDNVENNGINEESQFANDTINENGIVDESVVAEPVFVTPDLAFMEVYGHVKSVEYPNGRKAVFDEK